MLIATRYIHLLRRLSCWYLHTNRTSLYLYNTYKYPQLSSSISLSIPLNNIKIRKYSEITKSQNPDNNNNNNSNSNNNELLIRDSYVRRYHEVVTEPNQFIRLSVEGGGCSGFQYEFTFATKVGRDDVILERDGAKLLVDTVSLELLQGASVEYHEELIRSAFRVVDIPRAESGCSCGASFAIKS